MTEHSELTQIVTDPKLTSDAVRLVLFVRGLGPGEHEIDANELQALVRCRGMKPVRTARDMAVARGYLRIRPSSKGHPTAYQYIHTAATVGCSPETTQPGLGGLQSTPKPPVVVEVDDVVPPMVPLYPIAPDAETAIERHADVLTGCRDSLRDYLRRRVAPPRQSSYVHDIAGKINGLGFQWHGTPLAERSKMVSAALNELAATEESTEYKYPPGDPRNLRTKLSILVTGGFRSKQTGTNGGKRHGGKRDLPPDAQPYTPTDTWSGEFKS